ncbi:MAG: AI-2E family transporter, partial [Chthoniobacteraceae bacterium]
VLGLSYFIGAIAWQEGVQVWGDIPAHVDGWSGWLAGLRKQVPQIPSAQELASAAQDEVGQVAHYLGQTTSAVLGLLGGIGSALTVLVLVFYMLLEREKIGAALLSLIPPAHQPRLREVTGEALRTMGGWLRGQAILVLAMITIVTAAMAALGLPHPFLLGLVGGVGELIPMVGPIAAGLVAAPLAFITMPLWVGIVVVLFFVILSIVEANVVVPKVMKANVDLPPFFTVVAVLAGATLSGVVGALLALPLAAALRVYLRRLVVPAIQKK